MNDKEYLVVTTLQKQTVQTNRPTFTQEQSSTAHSLMVQSAEEVATHWSTGEKTTHHTPLRWPRIVPWWEPSAVLHNWGGRGTGGEEEEQVGRKRGCSPHCSIT